LVWPCRAADRDAGAVAGSLKMVAPFSPRPGAGDAALGRKAGCGAGLAPGSSSAAGGAVARSLRRWRLDLGPGTAGSQARRAGRRCARSQVGLGGGVAFAFEFGCSWRCSLAGQVGSAGGAGWVARAPLTSALTRRGFQPPGAVALRALRVVSGGAGFPHPPRGLCAGR
jgi:hypothetical protein